MPRYDYKCPACKNVFEAFRKIEHRNDVTCPDCGGKAEMTFIIAPMTQLASIDAMYNFSQGYYDYGLGCYIRTRKQREEKMAELGVTPLISETIEEVGAKPVKPSKIKVKMEDVKDAREYAHAMLRKGWRPPTENDVNEIKKSIGAA